MRRFLFRVQIPNRCYLFKKKKKASPFINL